MKSRPRFTPIRQLWTKIADTLTKYGAFQSSLTVTPSGRSFGPGGIASNLASRLNSARNSLSEIGLCSRAPSRLSPGQVYPQHQLSV